MGKKLDLRQNFNPKIDGRKYHLHAYKADKTLEP